MLKTSAVYNRVQLKLKTYFVFSPGCTSLKPELKLLLSPIPGLRNGNILIFVIIGLQILIIQEDRIASRLPSGPIDNNPIFLFVMDISGSTGIRDLPEQVQLFVIAAKNSANTIVISYER